MEIPVAVSKDPSALLGKAVSSAFQQSSGCWRSRAEVVEEGRVEGTPGGAWVQPSPPERDQQQQSCRTSRRRLLFQPGSSVTPHLRCSSCQMALQRFAGLVGLYGLVGPFRPQLVTHGSHQPSKGGKPW